MKNIGEIAVNASGIIDTARVLSIDIDNEIEGFKKTVDRISLLFSSVGIAPPLQINICISLIV